MCCLYMCCLHMCCLVLYHTHNIPPHTPSSYDFLVKGGEELRIDQRVQQLFDASNIMLRTQSSTAVLHVPTLDVIPLTPTLGLVGFVPDTIPLLQALTAHASGTYDVAAGVKVIHDTSIEHVKWLSGVVCVGCFSFFILIGGGERWGDRGSMRGQVVITPCIPYFSQSIPPPPPPQTHRPASPWKTKPYLPYTTPFTRPTPTPSSPDFTNYNTK